MSSLDSLEQALRNQPRKPPLEKWHPVLSGAIDIHIDGRGDWYHDGSPIKRQSLINLFASILRREDDGDYYLVTPVEKWRIRVDDTPLLAVDMEIVEPGKKQRIIFRLNTDELVLLNNAHRLQIENAMDQPHPVLELERGLSARLTTAVFYRLVDAAQQRGEEIGICSEGEWFSISQIED
ncbi:MAG TPA: DUF1285 domain-containing protein [Spongiibacteraceae bacterium]|jgi:hypothetical protein